MIKTVLFSSGMDSLVHLDWAVRRWGREQVQCLYVDFGQRYARKEIAAAGVLTSAYRVPLRVEAAQGFTESAEDAHIPLRNTYLLLRAAQDEDSDAVVFGMLLRETPEDKRPGYVRQMQRLFDGQFGPTVYRPQRRMFRIYTPFAGSTKTEMLRWWLHRPQWFGASHSRQELLRISVGCFSSGNPCGNCISCFNRWVALQRNHLCHADEPYVLGHPAQWALEQLRGARAQVRLQRSPGLRMPWLTLAGRHRWFREAYRAVDCYCREHYRLSLWHSYFASELPTDA